MAGANIIIEYQGDAALSSVLNLLDALADPEPMLAEMGEYLLNATVDRWATQASPEGTPWAPLSPRYKRRKDRERPGALLLVYDNFLRSTLRYQVEGGDLLFGTDRPYGATHQFGRGNIPARPWLGTSAEDDNQLVAIAQRHLQRAVAEG